MAVGLQNSAPIGFSSLTNYSSINTKPVQVPFDLAAMPMYVDQVSTSFAWFGGPATGIYHLVLDPNQIANGWYTFGDSVGLAAAAFLHYRVLKLELEWEPSVSVNTDGSLAMCYYGDGGVSSTSSATLQGVLACDGSTFFAVAKRTIIPVRNLDTNWKFVNDATAASTAGDRLDHAGAILTKYNVGSPSFTTSAGGLLGFVRMKGIIEFDGLGTNKAHPTFLKPRPEPVPSQDPALYYDDYPRRKYPADPSSTPAPLPRNPTGITERRGVSDDAYQVVDRGGNVIQKQ